MKEFFADPENKQLYRQSVKNIEGAFHQLNDIRQKLIDLHPEVKKSLSKGKDSSKGDGDNESDDEEIPSDIASGYSDNEGDEESMKFPSLKRRNEDNPSDDEEDQDNQGKNKKIRTEKNTPQTAEDFHEKFLLFR